MTLTVPLALINQVSPQRCEWLVPGLLEERLVALLRGLPKPIRKTLVPIPETAKRLAAHLTPSERPLVQAVAEVLREMTGVAVPEDAWGESALPEHLRMKFRLMDDQGRQVASGDDLLRLKRRYGRQGQQSFTAIPAQELERTGLRHWDFDALPESLELDRGGIRVHGYPVLIDQGDSIAIRVLDSQAGAAAAMRAGLCRLLMLRLGSDLRALRKKLPELDRMRLQYAKAPPPPGRDESEGPAEPVDLADELVALILDLAFLEGRPPIRDRRTFNARLEENRPQLAAVAGDACALTGRILTRYQAIRRRLADITQANWIASVKDMSGHLDALVFRGFLQQVPYARLQDYPRYLKALETRAEKLPQAASKDRQRLEEMADLQRKWRERTTVAQEARRQDTRLEEIRWLLEELRISLFAQQIGTARPVSVKRIETRWRELGL